MTTLDAIKAEGRADRTKGLDFHQNPYYRPERMPRTPGADFDLWRQKMATWEAGWGEADCEQTTSPQPKSRAATA